MINSLIPLKANLKLLALFRNVKPSFFIFIASLIEEGKYRYFLPFYRISWRTNRIFTFHIPQFVKITCWFLSGTITSLIKKSTCDMSIDQSKRINLWLEIRSVMYQKHDFGRYKSDINLSHYTLLWGMNSTPERPPKALWWWNTRTEIKSLSRSGGVTMFISLSRR